MKVRKNQVIALLGSVLLLAGLGVDAYAQQTSGPEVAGPVKRLSGLIRWKKEMGVLPKSPDDRAPAENICAQFFVVVERAGGQTAAYDNTLIAKPEPDKPDYYSCAFEMQVPSNVYLAIKPGMGDALAWPKTEKLPFHYTSPWISASGRPIRARFNTRSFSPINKVTSLGKKGMYLTFDLMYDDQSR